MHLSASMLVSPPSRSIQDEGKRMFQTLAIEDVCVVEESLARSEQSHDSEDQTKDGATGP